MFSSNTDARENITLGFGGKAQEMFARFAIYEPAPEASSLQDTQAPVPLAEVELSDEDTAFAFKGVGL